MQTLDLSDNDMGPQGAEYIADMLKENYFVVNLVSLEFTHWQINYHVKYKHEATWSSPWIFVLIAYASNEGSDEAAQTCSLTSSFTARKHKE